MRLILSAESRRKIITEIRAGIVHPVPVCYDTMYSGLETDLKHA